MHKCDWVLPEHVEDINGNDPEVKNDITSSLATEVCEQGGNGLSTLIDYCADFCKLHSEKRLIKTTNSIVHNVDNHYILIKPIKSWFRCNNDWVR